jgi:hypothetical protein
VERKQPTKYIDSKGLVVKAQLSEAIAKKRCHDNNKKKPIQTCAEYHEPSLKISKNKSFNIFFNNLVNVYLYMI